MTIIILIFLSILNAQNNNSTIYDKKIEIERLKLKTLEESKDLANTPPNLDFGFSTSSIGSRDVYLQQGLSWNWLRGLESSHVKVLIEQQQSIISKTEREAAAYKAILRLQATVLKERVKHLGERLVVIKNILNSISQLPQQVSNNRVDRFAVETKYRTFLMHQEETLNKYNLLKLELEKFNLQELNSPFINTKNFAAVEEIKKSWDEHIDLKLAEQDVQSQEIRVRRERVNQLPELTLGVRNKLDWGAIEENVLQVNFSIPIWDFNSSKINIEKSILESKKLAREIIQVQTKLSLNESIAEYNQALKSIEVYPPDLIKKLEQDLKSTERLFRNNSLNAINFLQLEESGHEQIELVLTSQLQLLVAYFKIIGPTNLPLNIEKALL